ncbi:MAG: 5-formyltetrahydrofolate cyclo-ligase [Aquabacterium sp.]|nr:5-formyltetrahydrofolate cyclo-ligase [Ferruginibacter sp.]
MEKTFFIPNLQQMKKQYIRELYKEKRAALPPELKTKLDDLLLIQFQSLRIDIPSLVMTYSPIKFQNEFDPQMITDYCYFKNPGQQLFYPVVLDGTKRSQIKSVVVHDETIFKTNGYGIEEPIDGIDMIPTEIDLVIVPLIAFDKMGNRVGYGKGYYDRFLKRCRKDCMKIGFSYFEPVEEIEDVNKLDVKLDIVITPDNIYQS